MTRRQLYGRLETIGRLLPRKVIRKDREMEPSEELLMNPELRMQKLFQSAAMLPEVVSAIPIHRYYRSLNELNRQAGFHMHEKEFEMAFIFYTRFISLAVERLPKHADFKHFVSSEKKKTEQSLLSAMTIAEALKKNLMIAFERDAENARAVYRNRAALIAAQAEPSTVEKGPSIIPSGNNGVIVNPDMTTDHLEFGQIGYSVAPSASSAVIPCAPSAARIGRSLEKRNQMFVARDLLSQFIALAASNTSKNIETCAILAGHPSSNVYRITHAVVPKQKGAPDNCDMLNEGEVCSSMESHNLISLGWIHTHPTQTAFLSSVDLHTQYIYQLMLPDSLAIVVAPKFDDVGVFRLSESGMITLGACHEKGFHPHDDASSLYFFCHDVQFEDSVHGTVVDLR